MKKNIIPIFLILLSSTTFGQQTINNNAPDAKPDYLKRSKNQQKIATILLLSGPVLVVTPLLISSGLKNGGDATGGLVYGTIAVGLLTLPVSITMFIIATGNQKKAMQLSFKSETAPQLKVNGFINKAIPSLSLKINL